MKRPGFCSTLLATATLLGPNLGAQTPVSFDAIRSYDFPTGRSIAPESNRACRPNVAAVDIDGDGRIDLVTGEITGSADHGFYLAALLGNGDGTFHPNAPPVNASPATLPPIASADLDGDGIPDIAIANGNSVILAFGNEDGTFQVSSIYGPLPSRLEAAIAIADFNGDGKPDIVLLDETGSLIIVFLNQGARLFRTVVTADGPDNSHAIVVGDFDGDGRLDVAVASGVNNPAGLTQNVYGISIFLGNGDGTFRRGGSLPTVIFPVSLAVGDFNGDGIPDLTTGQRVFLGLGNGAFNFSDTGISYDNDFTCVAVADLDRDGKQDLLVGRMGLLQLLPGNGDGTFGDATSIAAGNSNISLVTADLNADGAPDAVLLDAYPVSATILMNEGTGRFHTPPAYPVCCDPFGTVASGDLDGDGSPEIAYTESLGGEFIVLKARPDGSLVQAGSYPAPVLAPTPVVTDINRDGIADVVMLDGGFGGGIARLLPFLGQPGGAGLRPGTPTSINPGEGTLFAADLNGDGTPDLLIGRPHPFNSPFAGLEVALSNADGTFRPLGSIRPLALGGYPFVVSGDFDRDGKMDVILSNDTGTYLLTGNGDGTFRQSALLMATGGPIAAADLNGDGILDLVIAAPPQGLVLLTGRGDGTFENPVPPLPLIVGNNARVFPHGPLVIIDMNADGVPDLVFARGNLVAVQLGLGDGTFAPPAMFGAGTFNNFAIADVNGDGLPDIVLSTEGGVSVLRNATAVLAVPILNAIGRDKLKH